MRTFERYCLGKTVLDGLHFRLLHFSDLFFFLKSVKHYNASKVLLIIPSVLLRMMMIRKRSKSNAFIALNCVYFCGF